MGYNAANRKDVRRAEKEAKIAEQGKREVVTGLMQTIAGRRWMLERLEECHVFATSFSRDVHTMAFMEGQRDIGLKLLNDIMAACPDNYVLMMREANERRSIGERSGGPDANGRDQGSVTGGGAPQGNNIDDYGAEPGDDDADNAVNYDRSQAN